MNITLISVSPTSNRFTAPAPSYSSQFYGTKCAAKTFALFPNPLAQSSIPGVPRLMPDPLPSVRVRPHLQRPTTVNGALQAEVGKISDL